MDNLHFILNNILTKFFKELTKYKNDYQQCKDSICINLKLVLGSNVKGPNNKFVESGLKG